MLKLLQMKHFENMKPIGMDQHMICQYRQNDDDNQYKQQRDYYQKQIFDPSGNRLWNVIGIQKNIFSMIFLVKVESMYLV